MNIQSLTQKLKSITVGYRKREYGYTCIEHVTSKLSQHEYNYSINTNLISIDTINPEIIKINLYDRTS